MSTNSRKAKSLKINLSEFQSRPTETIKQSAVSKAPDFHFIENIKTQLKDPVLSSQTLSKIKKENMCNRSAVVIEQLHKLRMDQITKELQSTKDDYLYSIMQKFNQKLQKHLQQHIQARIDSISAALGPQQAEPKFVESEDLCYERIRTLKIRESTLNQHQQYKVKKNFKNSIQKFRPMIEKVNNFISRASEILQYKVLVETINPHFNKTNQTNEQNIKKATKKCDERLLNLLEIAIVHNKQTAKKNELKRLEKAQKQLEYMQHINQLYPKNLEGVLVTPFDLFSRRRRR